MGEGQQISQVAEEWCGSLSPAGGHDDTTERMSEKIEKDGKQGT